VDNVVEGPLVEKIMTSVCRKGFLFEGVDR